MTEDLRQRVRIRFSKGDDARFLSHHDLMRAWEMALRRSGLPLRRTEGFNPRIRLSMPMALGLGIASDDEIIEIELDGWRTDEEIRSALAPELPPGLALKELSLLRPGHRGQVAWVEYALRLDEAEGARLSGLLDLPEIRLERERQGERRAIDIRPYLLETRRAGEGDWRVRIKVTPQGTARPDEVLKALGLEGPAQVSRIRKTATGIDVPA